MFNPKVLPMIYQSEAAECGLACLSMMMAYHGHARSLNELRKDYQFSLKGTSVSRLVQIASEIGFNTSVLRLKISQVKTIALPAIVHWDMNHYVVIRKVNNKYITIHDPSRGVRKVTFTEFSQSFTGIVLELSNARLESRSVGHLRQKSTQWLLSLIGQYKFSLFRIIFAALVMQLAYLFSVNLVKYGIDSISLESSTSLVVISIILFGVKLVELGSSSLRQVLILKTGDEINKTFGLEVMRHLMELPSTYFMNRHSSSIFSRFSSIDKIRSALTEDFASIIIDSFVSVMTLAVMFYTSLLFGSIVIMGLLVSLLPGIYLCRRMRDVHESYLNSKANEMTHFMESIKAIMSIKIFSVENRRLSKWHKRHIATMSNLNRAAAYKLVYKLVRDLIGAVELSILIYFAFMSMSRSVVSAGVMYAFLAYRSQFITSFNSLLERLYDFKLLKVSLGRLDDIVSHEPELRLLDNSLSNLRHRTVSKYCVDNLSFKYPQDSSFVLTDVSFEVGAGESAVITGPSGCGKSTLFRIMCGLLQPSYGNLLVNGVPIGESNLVEYRNLISAVLQEDSVFSGTILENIHFFSSEIDMQRVISSAKLACIYDEIINLPLGFNTLIGGMGSVLSGGQKQRLLLARALYAKPSILLLDEASSHLDPDLEKRVNKSLRSLEIPIVMVAHRQETILMADKIIDLDSMNNCCAVL